jgi:ATP-dependent Clp protease ATP-binding subunit ClpC
MMRIRYPDGPAALSLRAQKAFQLAHQEAQRLNHPAVGTEHLLLGLAKEAESPAALFLCEFGFDLVWLRGQVERANPPGSSMQARLGVLPYTPDLESFLGALVAAAEGSGVMPLTPEHVLAALAQESDGIAARILRQRPIALGRLQQELQGVAGR